MGGTDELLGTLSHFLALHQLDLGAVEIDVVFAVDGALADIELAGQHHFAARFKRRRSLINEPGLDEKTKANG